MLRKALILAALAAVLARGGSAAENTDWFRDAKFGVMTHYLGALPSSDGGAELTAEKWNAQIDAFDVPGLVRQIASTGAKYHLFTLGQNSGHYCAPNATYDRFVGDPAEQVLAARPGGRTGAAALHRTASG